MTIICSDGITIAGDGRIMAGHSHIHRNDFRKIRVLTDPPRIYAVAGTLAIFDALVAWHEAGAKPEDAPKLPEANRDGWELLIIDRDGPVSFTSRTPYPFPEAYPVAMGCGEDYVISLLDFGLAPAEAIRVACNREAHAGGEIQVVNIAEVLGLQPVREAAE